MKLLQPLVFLGCSLGASFGYLAPSKPFLFGAKQMKSQRSFQPTIQICPLQMSSYSMDGSEYSPSDSDFTDDDDITRENLSLYRDDDDDDEDRDSPTVELQPVPMSKNSGNRFVALLWDKELDTKNRDALDLHNDRTALTEDHVMFCRKASLYNEEFNTDSMVDVLWSRQLYVLLDLFIIIYSLIRHSHLTTFCSSYRDS
jgi:hypothetical protein